MRKQVTTSRFESSKAAVENQHWLDLEAIATVEVTSEEDGFPIEGALLPGRDRGWRAAVPGAQTVRLHFDQPQRLTRIWLLFEERKTPRTQELVLRSSSSVGNLSREIVRQQWNFNTSNAVQEIEDYTVELADVRTLELTIVPDTSGGPAHASLHSMRLA